MCQKKICSQPLQMVVYKFSGAMENSAFEAQCSLGSALLMISGN